MNAFVARAGLIVAALGVVTGTAGCSILTHVLFSPRLRECKGFDVPLSVFVGPSRKELRARIHARNVDVDLPFVVETNADSLVLVGFTPLGTKAFTLVRKGDSVEVESMTGPALPVPPRNLMADVLAMSLPSACATTPDGMAVAAFDGWQVSDTCGNGRPVQRIIARADAKAGEEPEVQVEYRDDAIVVRQNDCRYNARYVLQASAPALSPENGVSDAAEE